MEDFLSTAVNVTDTRGNSLINRKMILRILGTLLFMEAMMFLACAGVSLCYGEEDYIYFIYTTLIRERSRKPGDTARWILYRGVYVAAFHRIRNAAFLYKRKYPVGGRRILWDHVGFYNYRGNHPGWYWIAFARYVVLAKLFAMDWRIGYCVLYDCCGAYLWGR